MEETFKIGDLAIGKHTHEIVTIISEFVNGGYMVRYDDPCMGEGFVYYSNLDRIS